MSNTNGSNDIAEMLRLLRESVDNDREKLKEDSEDKQEEIKEPEEIEEETSPEEDDSDPWYDDEEEESTEDEDVDIEIASEDEREPEEDDDSDPWFNSVSEVTEESIEDLEETVEEPEEDDDLYDLSDISDDENIVDTDESEEDEIDVFAYPEDDFCEEEISPEDSGVIIDVPEDEELINAEELVELESIPEDEIIDEEIAEIEELEEDKTDREALDETDINLLKNMGYGQSVINEMLVKNESISTVPQYTAGDIAYDNNGAEYVLKKQNDEIKADYATQKRNTVIRLIIAGFTALLLFVYEYLAFTGAELPGLLNKAAFPVSHSMISLQLLLIAAAMSLNLISKGISDTFCFRSTPYSAGSVLILLNAIYTIVIAVVRPEDYMLFNSVGAFAAVLLIGYEYALLINEEKTFDAISFEGQTKYSLEQDNKEKNFGDMPTMRAYSTDFNNSFFDRMSRRVSAYNYLNILMPIVVVMGIVIFTLVLVISENLSSAITAGMMTVNFSLPLGVVGTYSIPMLCAVLSMKKESGAIVGNSSVAGCSNTRFVTFDETDVFPSMKTTYIDLKPAGDRPISETLGKTSKLFAAIGGPLSHMIETSGEQEIGGDVEIISIFDDGISAKLDSEDMLVGSAGFLEINNIDITASTDYKDDDDSNEILYVAIGGKLAARYYIKYQPDPDFVDAVNDLGAKGISVGIRTRNPGVNSRIIEKRCPEMKYKVYTIKSLSDDEKDLTSHQNTTNGVIVSHGKAITLARPLLLSLMLEKYYKIDTYIRCATAFVGILGVAIFAAMGRIGDMSSLVAVLYQLAGFIPTGIAAWIICKPKKNNKTKELKK